MILFLKGCSLIQEVNNIITKDASLIINRLIQNNATVYLVGGAIRDFLLDFPVNDIDLEVYNIDFTLLKDIFNDYDVYVNEKFKSIKLLNIEIALPRTEHKVGLSYLDYQLNFYNITPQEASQRRDFTINSIMYCFNDKRLYDFSTGKHDLDNKIIKAQNYKTYSDDPIRVLRLLKYQVRYNFSIDYKTKIQSKMIAKDIFYQPKAMVASLFTDIITHENFDINLFLDVLYDFFMVNKLESCISESIYHPEKSLFNHITGVIISLQQYKIATKRDFIVLFWALFFHDYGKVMGNKEHAQKGVDIFSEYEEYLINRQKDRLMIKKLIIHHMHIREYAQAEDIELMNELKMIFGNQFYLLEIVGTCDYAGRVVNNDVDEIKIRMKWYQENIIIKYKEINNG